jgi:hypothetical protein
VVVPESSSVVELDPWEVVEVGRVVVEVEEGVEVVVGNRVTVVVGKEGNVDDGIGIRVVVVVDVLVVGVGSG